MLNQKKKKNIEFLVVSLSAGFSFCILTNQASFQPAVGRKGGGTADALSVTQLQSRYHCRKRKGRAENETRSAGFCTDGTGDTVQHSSSGLLSEAVRDIPPDRSQAARTCLFFLSTSRAERASIWVGMCHLLKFRFFEQPVPGIAPQT